MPIVKRKPGGPFRATNQCARSPAGHNGGNRPFVKVLAAAQEGGRPDVVPASVKGRPPGVAA